MIASDLDREIGFNTMFAINILSGLASSWNALIISLNFSYIKRRPIP